MVTLFLEHLFSVVSTDEIFLVAGPSKTLSATGHQERRPNFAPELKQRRKLLSEYEVQR